MMHSVVTVVFIVIGMTTLVFPGSRCQDLVFMEETPFYYNFTEVAELGVQTLLSSGTGDADSAEVFLDGISRGNTRNNAGIQPLVGTTLPCELGTNPGKEHSISVLNEFGGVASFVLGINFPKINTTNDLVPVSGTSPFVETRVFVDVPLGVDTMRILFNYTRDTSISTQVDVFLGCPPNNSASSDYSTLVPATAGSETILEVDTTTSVPPLQTGELYTIGIAIPRLFVMEVGTCFSSGCIPQPLPVSSNQTSSTVTASSGTMGGGGGGGADALSSSAPSDFNGRHCLALFVAFIYFVAMADYGPGR